VNDGAAPGGGSTSGAPSNGGLPDEIVGRARSQPVRWRRLGGDADPVPEGRTPRNVDRGRRIGILLSHLLYRMDIRGSHRVPSSGPLVVVANHSAFVDGPILFGKLPRRISFLVKAEAVRGPLGWLLRTVGQYAINRAAPERQVLMSALAQLKSGGAIGIFPEGARGAGDVAAVFNGAGWLAARAGAAVVPVAVRGTARPIGRRVPRFRPVVRVRVGEPFDIKAGAGRTAIAAATGLIQQRLVALIGELDAEIAGHAVQLGSARKQGSDR
jgi:1-acyl-sn-glycerol-3-phosphate acyltransferase